MRKWAFALTMVGGLLVGGVPAAKASVSGAADATQNAYARYRVLEGQVPDGRLQEGAQHELVQYRTYNRYRSPNYYRGGYRGYATPRYYYRNPGYYRYPGNYYRYGAPYYGRGWGYGRPGFYFGFGF